MALMPGGGQAQYVTVPEGFLMPIPAGLTLPQAAAIPEAWLTAFQLLHLVGEELPTPPPAPCSLHTDVFNPFLTWPPQNPVVLQGSSVLSWPLSHTQTQHLTLLNHL